MYKKIEYIPYDCVEDYAEGEFAEDIAAEFHALGKKYVKVSAAVNGNDETVPYRVGQFYFNEGNGLYIILGYDEDAVCYEFENLLTAAGYSGVGGERSSGLGRFTVKEAEDTEDLLGLLGKPADRYMTLSSSLPREEELENVLKDARYRVIKKSGFAASTQYAKDQRKRDLYVLAAGACVTQMYEGDVYDVGTGEAHPVYRYAKPIFMEV